MTTKTEQISSGLVAVAWLTEVPNMLFFDLDEAEMYCVEDDPIALVRLSDAEAIIAAKDVEIERLALYKNLADEYGLSVFADLKEQSAALKLAREALTDWLMP